MTPRQRRQQLLKVGRVYATRTSLAEKRYREQLEVCRELERGVLAHDQTLEGINANLTKLVDYNSTQTVFSNSSKVANATAYRYWIMFDMEKEQHFRTQKIQKLKTERPLLAQHKSAWLQARIREQAMDEAVDRERVHIERADELQAEIELEDISQTGGARYV